MNLVFYAINLSLIFKLRLLLCLWHPAIVFRRRHLRFAASGCLFLNEADRRHDGASSAVASGSVASGDGGRPLGGLPSVFMMSGDAGGLSVTSMNDVVIAFGQYITIWNSKRLPLFWFRVIIQTLPCYILIG